MGRRIGQLVKLLVAAATAGCNAYDLKYKLEHPADIAGCINCGIFVSASVTSGNIGGIAGADAICKTDANNPRPSSPRGWKAMIVDGVGRRACSAGLPVDCSITQQIDWVLKPNTTYIRPNYLGITEAIVGVTDANATLWHSPLANYIGGGFDIWTGMLADGTTGDHCSQWTDGSTGTGAIGLGDTQNFEWIATSGSPISCAATNTNLYCVEQ